jgi:hypothetical protein
MPAIKPMTITQRKFIASLAKILTGSVQRGNVRTKPVINATKRRAVPGCERCALDDHSQATIVRRYQAYDFLRSERLCSPSEFARCV